MLKYILISLAITYALSALACDDGEYADSTITPNKCKPCKEHCKTCAEASKCASCDP